MKKKDWLFGGIVLIIIILILVISFIVKGKTLKENDPLVQELYSYLGENDLQYCNGLNNYSDELVNYDNLSNSNRLCRSTARLYENKKYETITLNKDKKKDSCTFNDNIIFALDDDQEICTVYKIAETAIEEEYNKLYNKKIEEKEAFNLNNKIICTYDEGFYYCGSSLTFTLTIGADPSTYRSIKNVYLKNDEIIIYDYFLKTINNDCYLTFTTSDSDSICSEKYQDKKLIDYKFLRKYGTLYKHTFKKNQDNYYWFSSEKAN